ncbi:acetyl-CoA C-acyltransferase [Sphingobacteriaceae bacterium]|nr:acetyl-CoA C-acyltransferase [Sphingobacteriaceae bacterium]
MTGAYIIDFQRTPYGKYGGALSNYRPDDLAALVIKSLVKRNKLIDLSEIDDIILGCANQAGEDNRNIARFAGLLAELPVDIPGVTVNRLCASGMQSVMDATARIQAGLDHIIIAGGVESMSRAPYVMLKASKGFDRNLEMVDTTLGWRFVNPAFESIYKTYSMGETAENIAEQWLWSREAQDDFALASHKKYLHAYENGIFEKEIIPLTTTSNTILNIDEAVRKDTTIEKLSSLKTIFKSNGTVTAGNASGLNDGAAAMIIVSEDVVNKYKLKPIAKILSTAVAGVHPDFMGTGPIPATKKLLEKTRLQIKDIDLFEINEAYAVQVIHCIRELKIDAGITNVNGGAIAIGHPLGSSGTRITGHLALELNRSNKKYGIATMCVGVGQGTAVLIENVNYKS